MARSHLSRTLLRLRITISALFLRSPSILERTPFVPLLWTPPMVSFAARCVLTPDPQSRCQLALVFLAGLSTLLESQLTSVDQLMPPVLFQFTLKPHLSPSSKPRPRFLTLSTHTLVEVRLVSSEVPVSVRPCLLWSLSTTLPRSTEDSPSLLALESVPVRVTIFTMR